MSNITKEQRKKLKKIKFLKDFKVVNGVLHLNFGEIYGKGRWYKGVLIGDFNITVKIEKYSRHVIKVFNKKPIINDGRKLIHPHVTAERAYDNDSSNDPCLGYYRSDIIKNALSSGNYALAIIQLWNFLNTYTPGDKYYNLRYFKHSNTNEKGERIYNGRI